MRLMAGSPRGLPMGHEGLLLEANCVRHGRESVERATTARVTGGIANAYIVRVRRTAS